MFSRRKIDTNSPPPLPKIGCPYNLGQIVELRQNIKFRIDHIKKCDLHEDIRGIHAGWYIKGCAFYGLPKSASEIAIDKVVDPGLGSSENYFVTYKRYGATYKEEVIKSWVNLGCDEYGRTFAIHYEITDLVPDRK